MRLRCECGGPARCQDGTDPERARDAMSIWERYECKCCGRTGTLTHDRRPGETRLRGCLTRTEVAWTTY